MRPHGPPGFPLLGHLPWFVPDRLRFLERCALRYGPTVRLELRGTVYLVLSPDDVRHVQCSPCYTKSRRNVGSGAQKLWGRSLITLEGESHRRRRIELVRALHAKHGFEAIWDRTGSDWWTGLRHGAEFDLGQEAERLSRAAWLHCLFGEPREDLVETVRRRQAWIERSLLGIGAGPDPSGPLRTAIRQTREGFGRIFTELGMSAADREEEMLGLTVEGYEGTARLLVWAAVQSARDPDQSSADAVASALRLHPPTWLFARLARTADRLPSGVSVEPGTRIFLSPYLTHLLFPKSELMAFGVGPRRCPGRQLAERQAEVWIEELRRHGHLQLLNEPALRGGIMLEPARPVWVRFRRSHPPAPPARPEISVVVPSRNRPRALIQLLRALLRQSERNFEVVICDDGSQPPLSPVVQEYADRLPLRLVRLERRRGPASARQAAIDVAVGRYLVFTDDDCRPEPDWLAHLFRALRADPDTAVGGATDNGLRCNWFSEASQSLIGSLYEECPGDFLATNNIAFERTRLEAVGGLPKDWPLSGGEDRELCRRWSQRYSLRLIPEARVLHYHELSLTGFLRQHFNYGRGGARFGSGGGRLPGRSVRFWRAVFGRPFREHGLPAGLVVALLLGVAQLANAGGHLYERVLQGRRRRP